MTEAVFLDTSGLYEAGDRHAPRHREAQAVLRAAATGSRVLVTTEMILAETHAMVLRRVGPEMALAVVERIVETPRVEVVAVDSELRRQALAFLRARPGRSCSLADAISFEVMRARGITRAFTLDAEFAAEGFEVMPVSDE